MKQNKGFTLVELIIVIAILAIIMLIAIPNFSGIQQRMQVRADKATAAQIGKAVRVWFTDCSTDDGLITGHDKTVVAKEDATLGWIAGKWAPEDLPVRSGTGTVSVAATNYENLIGIDEYIGLKQYPSSMKISDSNTASETKQQYGIFLTAGPTASSAKIVVAIIAPESTVDANKTVSVSATGEVPVDYDGIGSGVAYVEP